MEAPLYNQEGEKIGTTTLPDAAFALPWNADLVHQVITSLTSSARAPIAHAKGRGEVSGGGKKPWKQKGTGRSRHGSIRSPIWKGGGVAHGPNKERVFFRKVNRTMKTKALFTILSKKLKDNELIVLNSLVLSEPKTKQAARVLSQLAHIPGMESVNYRRGNRVLVLIPEKDPVTRRAFRNIPSVMVEEVRSVNPLIAAQYRSVLLSKPDLTCELLVKKLS